MVEGVLLATKVNASAIAAFMDFPMLISISWRRRESFSSKYEDDRRSGLSCGLAGWRRCISVLCSGKVGVCTS